MHLLTKVLNAKTCTANINQALNEVCQTTQGQILLRVCQILCSTRGGKENCHVSLLVVILESEVRFLTA